MATYDIGDRIRLEGVFTDADGVETDPTRIFIDYINPSGTEVEHEYGVDAEVIRSSAGTYHEDINVDEGGWWRYRWYGVDAAGDYQGASEEKFYVRKSTIAGRTGP